MDDAAIEFNLEPWQIEEIDKCRQSFEYFASKYIFITHPKRGLVNFNMYPYQHRMVGDYNKYRFNLISKFRQGGATTTTVLWCMWRCLFMCDQKILVVSIGDREAIGAGKMVKTALENLPPWMQCTSLCSDFSVDLFIRRHRRRWHIGKTVDSDRDRSKLRGDCHERSPE
jgi:hypothetical protein